MLNFNFKIYYLKESENIKADALNRRLNYIENRFQIIKLILLLQQNERIIYNTKIITAIIIITNNILEDKICKEYLKDN